MTPSLTTTTTMQIVTPDEVQQASAISRSTSASSSLDPYYFQNHSTDNISPAPPLPVVPQEPRTPDARSSTFQPTTPHRDPATIDRGALHGLGELATPRWTRRNRDEDEEQYTQDLSVVHESPGQDEPQQDGAEQDAPDSPWTIEAIDGEGDDEDEGDSEAGPATPSYAHFKERESAGGFAPQPTVTQNYPKDGAYLKCVQVIGRELSSI